jgi:hypothetical protein
LKDNSLQDKIRMKQNNYWNCYNAGVKKTKEDINVMPSIGQVVTSDWLDVACVSSIPVAVEGCVNLGCYKPSFRS